MSRKRDNELHELEMELQERMRELENVRDNGGFGLEEAEANVAEQRNAIDAYKKNKGVSDKPIDKIVERKMATPPTVAAKPPAANQDFSAEIKTVEGKIADLENRFKEAHRRKADQKILAKIHSMIFSEKMALADLESKRDEQSTEGKKLKLIQQLEDDLEQLHAERARLDQVISTKEGQLAVLRPVDPNAPLNAEKKIDEVEDDMERLLGTRGDARAEYQRKYGVAPSDPKGVMLATVRVPKPE